jgi:SAM-dependent methyltransferase
MLHSVRSGETAFARVFAAPIFEYYAAHPDAASTSAKGLAARSAQENTAILAAYDFSSAPHVIDVGGGQGTLLQAILERHAGATGMLFERPQVAAMARAQFEKSDLAPRCRVIAGDLFRSIPAGGDLYLLKKVIHDWDDTCAAAILRSCRAAMAPSSRLLLLEPVVAEPNVPSFAALLDLLMLVVSGGQERTLAEHSRLLAQAGLRLTRTIPTASAVSILEAVCT